MRLYHIEGKLVPEDECRQLVRYGLWKGWLRPPAPEPPQDAVDRVMRQRQKQKACMRRLRAKRNGKAGLQANQVDATV
jgi:hypothetical protein